MHNPSRAAAREGADDGARGCRRRRAATEDSTSGRGQRQLDGNRSRAARHADRALQRLLASSTLREGSCALATGAQRGLEQLEDNPSRAAALSKGQRSKRQLHLHEHEQSRQGAARSAARAGARAGGGGGTPSGSSRCRSHIVASFRARAALRLLRMLTACAQGRWAAVTARSRHMHDGARGQVVAHSPLFVCCAEDFGILPRRDAHAKIPLHSAHDDARGPGQGGARDARRHMSSLCRARPQGTPQGGMLAGWCGANGRAHLCAASWAGLRAAKRPGRGSPCETDQA